MQNCPVCGAPIKEGALFCTECGHKIEAPQPQQPQQPQQPVSNPQYTTGSNVPPPHPQQTYTYGQPQQPNPQYQQPNTQYQQPNPQYQQPNPQYQQPNPQYRAPAQPYQPQTQYYGANPAAPVHPKNGLCIVSLVFGILGLVCIGPIGSIVGLITGIIALKAGPDGKAKAGVVCSIIGLVLGLISFIAWIVAIASGTGALYEIYNEMINGSGFTF